MPTIPMLQMHQQFVRIGIQTTPGKLEMRQPPAEVDITTSPSKLEMHNAFQAPAGRLSIDQSTAREALGQGSPFWLTRQVAAESRSIALQGIARRAEDGQMLADIAHHKENVIGELAARHWREQAPLRLAGPAGGDNVKIDFTRVDPDIHFSEPQVQIQVKPNPPEIRYTPGSVNYSIVQKPQLTIIPPQIDMKV